ncbi:unnamed protein product [Amoebophrya sp. A120]|nr:unnamed protein product [Amoebophrya sp. A120]|eukprot:GSA120T00001124001.1
MNFPRAVGGRTTSTGSGYNNLNESFTSSGGAFGFAATSSSSLALSGTRDNIRRQMKTMLNSIFARFPQLFVESVLRICRDKQSILPSLLETLASLEKAKPEIVLRCVAVAFEKELSCSVGSNKNKTRTASSKEVPREVSSAKNDHADSSIEAAFTTHNEDPTTLTGRPTTSNLRNYQHGTSGTRASTTQDGSTSSRGPNVAQETTPVSSCIPPNEENLLLYFLYSYMSHCSRGLSSLEILWKSVARIATAAVKHSKQPVTMLWVLSLIQLCDGITQRNLAVNARRSKTGRNTTSNGSALQQPILYEQQIFDQLDIRRFRKDVTALVVFLIGLVAMEQPTELLSGSTSSSLRNKEHTTSEAHHLLHPPLPPQLEMTREYDGAQKKFWHQKTLQARSRVQTPGVSSTSGAGVEIKDGKDPRQQLNSNNKILKTAGASTSSSNLDMLNKHKSVSCLPCAGPGGTFGSRGNTNFDRSPDEAATVHPVKTASSSGAHLDLSWMVQQLQQKQTTRGPHQTLVASSSPSAPSAPPPPLPARDQLAICSLRFLIVFLCDVNECSSTQTRFGTLFLDALLYSSKYCSLVHSVTHNELQYLKIDKGTTKLFQEEWVYLLLTSVANLPFDLYRESILKTKLNKTLVSAVNSPNFFALNVSTARSLRCWAEIVGELLLYFHAEQLGFPTGSGAGGTSGSEEERDEQCYARTRTSRGAGVEENCGTIGELQQRGTAMGSKQNSFSFSSASREQQQHLQRIEVSSFNRNNGNSVGLLNGGTPGRNIGNRVAKSHTSLLGDIEDDFEDIRTTPENFLLEDESPEQILSAQHRPQEGLMQQLHRVPARKIKSRHQKQRAEVLANDGQVQLLFQICWPSKTSLLQSVEQDRAQRLQFLRRLCFVLYAGAENQFASELRDIMDKLSECLQTVANSDLQLGGGGATGGVGNPRNFFSNTSYMPEEHEFISGAYNSSSSTYNDYYDDNDAVRTCVGPSNAIPSPQVLSKTARYFSELRSEVLFVIRMLLLKMSPRYLTPCWPMILAELIGVFSSLSTNCLAVVPPQIVANSRSGREGDGIANQENQPKTSYPKYYLDIDQKQVLAALKLVDMAGLLDLEEYTLHSWMFQPIGCKTSSNLRADGGGGSSSGLNSSTAAEINYSHKDLAADLHGNNKLKKFRPFSVTLKRLLDKAANPDFGEQELSSTASTVSKSTSIYAQSAASSKVSSGVAGRGELQDNSSSTSSENSNQFSQGQGVINAKGQNVCIDKDTRLSDACRVLNDASIHTILARQRITHETRMRLAARDFLPANAPETPDFEAREYLSKMEMFYVALGSTTMSAGFG